MAPVMGAALFTVATRFIGVQRVPPRFIVERRVAEITVSLLDGQFICDLSARIFSNQGFRIAAVNKPRLYVHARAR